ncbi:MAG TPA: FKBP-type peptidyl-prolyl cis-trans isomerase [Ktedonobacteraceae bacterium]|nr:FKBP-type peptidyl-prolyl cis-trans isomerase [Ktedonobacteraceae bacterium]
MTQTVNGRKNNENNSQKQRRPGQRQQERLMRLQRRRRRQQIWTSSIIAIVIIILASIGIWQYNRVQSQQQAASAAATATTTARTKATATAVSARATATSVAIADATAIAQAQSCFVSPPGTTPTSIYSGTATPTAGPSTAPHIVGTPVKLSGGLEYIDIVKGTGATVKKGNTISVEYTGWIASTCKKFDSSYDNKGQAFTTQIGTGQVIPGWDEGLIGMKVGGTRRLLIPASLAYGAQGSPPTIPPNAILIFDVTLLSTK